MFSDRAFSGRYENKIENSGSLLKRPLFLLTKKAANRPTLEFSDLVWLRKIRYKVTNWISYNASGNFII